LDVQFTPLLPQQQVYANTDEIAARQLIEGGSGEHDLYISLSSVLPFALVSGTNLAQNYVDGLKQLSGQISMATYRGGLKTGQSIQVNIPQIKAVGSYVVDQVTLTDSDRLCLWSVTLITGAAIGDWKTAMKGITGGGALTSSGISGGVGGGGVSSGRAYSLIVQGTLAIGSDMAPVLYVVDATTPTTLRADVPASGVPVGSPLVVSLSYSNTPGGTAIPVSTLTIPDGLTSSIATTSVSVPAGSFWRIDITSVGTTFPGANLTVTIQ
jgi:hypothetical protein